MTAPPPTDAALLRATAAGDEEAFLEIYRRYQDRVFRFASRMTGSREAAEDVTHNCFASLLERPRGFEPGRSGLGTYLCAAARNQSLTHARRTWREASGMSGPDHRAAREPGPLDLVLAHERGRMVREALLRLAPLHREVVIGEQGRAERSQAHHDVARHGPLGGVDAAHRQRNDLVRVPRASQ